MPVTSHHPVVSVPCSSLAFMSAPLQGQVALLTGATRGAGRGIAVELGAAGATVCCTGRTSGDHRSAFNRPETIEETAALVTAAGGSGIAVRVDHSRIEEAEPSSLASTWTTMGGCTSW